MLSIPALIKNRFKADGIRKNLRIHFSNGEYPDIINDSIIKESMRFTESLCSQDVFKFGLAEASVLEFETVGIGNMYGMTIEAGIEVDVSNLSVQQMAAISNAIAGGTYVGKIVSKANSDTGFAYYRVPLGVFRVESCPRNHQNMAHRKVTAYGPAANIGALAEFEEIRLSLGLKAPRCFTSTGALRYSILGKADPSVMSELTATTVAYTDMSSSAIAGNRMVEWKVGADTYGIDVNVTRRTYDYPSPSPLVYPWLAVFDFDPGDIDAHCLLDKAREWADTYGGIPSSFVSAFRNCATLEQALLGSWARVTSTGIASKVEIAGVNDVIDYIPFYDPVTAGALVVNYGDEAPTFTAFESILIKLMKNGAELDRLESSCSGRMPSMVTYTGGSVGTLLQYAETGEEKSPNGKNIYRTYIGADLDAIFRGMLEAKGVFGRTDRLGIFEETALDPSSPIEIGPPDYSRGEVWWDEYDVSPIGAVEIAYGEKDEVQTVTVGDGASVYDMTDNEMLRMVYPSTTETVAALLAGDFAANAANVGFTPVDMAMQGWPWMEAGDALEVTAEDGSVIDTYALRIEISGIQRLEARIESKGGQIIGEA